MMSATSKCQTAVVLSFLLKFFSKPLSLLLSLLLLLLLLLFGYIGYILVSIVSESNHAISRENRFPHT